MHRFCSPPWSVGCGLGSRANHILTCNRAILISQLWSRIAMIVCLPRFVLSEDCGRGLAPHIHMAADQNHVPPLHVPMPSDPEGLDRILDPEGVER